MGVTDYKLQNKKISKFEDTVIETILNETQKEKRLKKTNRASVSCGTTSSALMYT